MDEGIGLVAVGVVFGLAVEDVEVIAWRGAIGDTLVEANFAAHIIGVVFDVERLYGADAIGARQEFVQIGLRRGLSRDVVPAERVLIPSVSLEHRKREAARGDERFGGCGCVRCGVDCFAAAHELTL